MKKAAPALYTNSPRRRALCNGQRAVKACCRKNLINYSYCAPDGKTDSSFPTNPNGSIENIAALGNAAGNAMAIMPHPERTINGEGDSIFRAMYKFLKEEKILAIER